MESSVRLRVFRWVGNIALLIGHFILLYVSLFWGLVLCFCSNLSVLPYYVKTRMWDVVIVLSFFSVIEVGKLLSLMVGG